MNLLNIQNLGMRFGGLLALEDFCLEVPEGALYGLIGPNGAGKTTVFNLISGFLRPSRGRISLNGAEITRLPPHRITYLGVARTFQNIRLFQELSVLDNVLVGFHCRSRASWGEAILRLPRYRARGKGATRPGPGTPPGGRLGRGRGPTRRQTPLRPPAAPGDRPGPGHRSPLPLAG